MAEKIKYSFIIPIKAVNDYIREAVPKILSIAREDYEIIIYPDAGFETTETWPKTRQIPSGRGPALKRNLAVKDARGDFLVFIDDDAYPRKDILDVLDGDFSDETIAAVGGPAITPGSDSFLQKVSGAVFLSYLSGGFPERYVPVGEKRLVCDWPTVNLTVRKSAFLEAGGFDCEFWPGEDTKLCLDIMDKLKEKNKILYDPDVIVWHHRREGLLRHLKQVGSYGIHRGFFAKTYPKTSFKLRYFIPSMFLLFIFGGLALSYFSVFFEIVYIVGWSLYGLAMLVVLFDITRRQKNLLVALYALVYVFFTHLVYGARFLQGFIFTKKLKSKLR
jgi:cellulose synthase/poly-beta-1,6-N-acetylglucosamine synthase-like glycosyltransferase